MKEFFGNLNLPRVVILLSFLASAVLAWFNLELDAKLDQLREEEKNLAPDTVRNIQELSIRITQLKTQLQDDQWLGQNNPGSYVRTIAQDNTVMLGQVDVVPSRDDKLGNGVVDKKYTVRPVNKDRGWSKNNLGNFLWTLENNSQRVRVTRVKIHQPSKRRTKPHEIPPDEWTYEVEITSRQREST